MQAIIIWFVVFIVMVIIELVSPALVSIWFALGALVTLIASLIGLDSIVWQFVLFVIVSVIALIATRPLAKKYLKSKQQPTNADMLIGRDGQCIVAIDNLKSQGRVKIDGMEWTAREADGLEIPEGATVTVTGIEGVKLIVKLK